MQRSDEKGGGSLRAWVPLVVMVGLLAGFVIASLPTPVYGPLPRHGHHFGPHFETAEDVDIILSTVSIVLLIALVAVYARIYGETGASFAAGLVIVFLALLLHSIATWPPVYGAFGTSAGELGSFLLLSNIFKVIAFTILLYLSLE